MSIKAFKAFNQFVILQHIHMRHIFETILKYQDSAKNLSQQILDKK